MSFNNWGHIEDTLIFGAENLIYVISMCIHCYFCMLIWTQNLAYLTEWIVILMCQSLREKYREMLRRLSKWEFPSPHVLSIIFYNVGYYNVDTRTVPKTWGDKELIHEKSHFWKSFLSVSLENISNHCIVVGNCSISYFKKMVVLLVLERENMFNE